jgi:hypothetical protein
VPAIKLGCNQVPAIKLKSNQVLAKKEEKQSDPYSGRRAARSRTPVVWCLDAAPVVWCSDAAPVELAAGHRAGRASRRSPRSSSKPPAATPLEPGRRSSQVGAEEPSGEVRSGAEELSHRSPWARWRREVVRWRLGERARDAEVKREKEPGGEWSGGGGDPCRFGAWHGGRGDSFRAKPAELT